MVVVMLAGGLAILIAGAQILVMGASDLARRAGLSELVIGLTVVAFGTSAPELFVSGVSTWQGNASIAVTNILGSNLFNILIILGLCAVIRPLAVASDTVWRGIPLMLLSAVLMVALPADGVHPAPGQALITRPDGLVFLCLFAVFLYFTASITQEAGAPSPDRVGPGLFLSTALVLAGLPMLVGGAELFIGAAVRIAASLGMSQSLIGLTIVGIGTSLPELATSLVATVRGRVDMAVGNVVGSNIFNVFLILGMCATTRPLTVLPAEVADSWVVLGASAALFVFMFTGTRRRLDRWEGALFLVGYAVYLVFRARMP